MKKLITLIALLVLCSGAFSQLFFTMEPEYRQPGIMYIQNEGDLPYYARIRVQKFERFNDEAYYFKESLGTHFKINEYSELLVGATLSHVEKTNKNMLFYQLEDIFEGSFELGFRMKVSESFYVVVMQDFLNWETDFGVSLIVFNKK